MNSKQKQDILQEIRYLEADISNINGDILDLENEKEDVKREIKKLRDKIEEVK